MYRDVYRILIATTLADLEQQVDGLLSADGAWEPVGGILHLLPIEGINGIRPATFSQAVWRRVDR